MDTDGARSGRSNCPRLVLRLRHTQSPAELAAKWRHTQRAAQQFHWHMRRATSAATELHGVCLKPRPKKHLRMHSSCAIYVHVMLYCTLYTRSKLSGIVAVCSGLNAIKYIVLNVFRITENPNRLAICTAVLALYQTWYTLSWHNSTIVITFIVASPLDPFHFKCVYRCMLGRE